MGSFFQAVRNAFRLPDLRKRILFTLFIIAVYRLGSHIPVPGVDLAAVRELAARAKAGGIYAMINLFSGGALTNFAVFALGIMPYITASIIMQLLTVVIPRLEQLQKEGEVGYRKIVQYTRYVTVVLALLQSSGLVVMAHQGQLLQGVAIVPDRYFKPGWIAFMVLVLTAGTALIMWLGELITQRGLGNGMSILIFVSVISSFPGEGSAILAQTGPVRSAFLLLLGLAIVFAVVLVEQGQRRVEVQYAKRIVGRRVYGGQRTYIPIKVNQAGVIPIIFAASLLYLPVLAATIVQWRPFTEFVNNYLSRGSGPLYILLYFVLVVFFTYFYTAITFNPVDVADQIKKYGGFIPGVRPGQPTAEYLEHILSRITLPGSLYLAAVAVLPYVFLGIWNIQRFPFGGTAVLIAVGVALETMKQLEAQLLMRHYEGFVK